MRHYRSRFKDKGPRFPDRDLEELGFEKVKRPANMAPRDISENIPYERTLGEILSDAYDNSKEIIHSMMIGLAKGLVLLLNKHKGKPIKTYLSRSTDIPEYAQLRLYRLN